MNRMLLVCVGTIIWLNQSAVAGEPKVSNVQRSGSDFVAVTVQDTVKGQKIVCALYDSAGNAVASNTWQADNLATQVLIQYSGDFASAKCAED